jgi:hypothetical protein
LCIPVVPVVLAFVALKKIKRSDGRLSGAGLAKAGMVLGFVGIAVLLAVPLVVKQRKAADRARALNCLRCLSCCLMEFEFRYGAFPSPEVRRVYPEVFKNIRPGDHSNQWLGMLIAGGIVDSEEVFYAKGGSPVDRKPDNIFDTPESLLAPGECGFGYVMLQDGKPLSSSPQFQSCPVLVAPLAAGSGGKDPRFNPRPYDRRAIYLRVDMATFDAPVGPDGRVLLHDDHHLFQTGPESVWGHHLPNVRPPE